jgi:hypothetical protein
LIFQALPRFRRFGHCGYAPGGAFLACPASSL